MGKQGPQESVNGAVSEWRRAAFRGQQGEAGVSVPISGQRTWFGALTLGGECSRRARLQRVIPDTGGACVLVSGGAKTVWEEVVVTDPRGFQGPGAGPGGPPRWQGSLGDFSNHLSVFGPLNWLC